MEIDKRGFDAAMQYLSDVTQTTKAILHSYPHEGFVTGILKAYESAKQTEQPDEKPESLAKARPWPGMRNVDLMQIATNAFCRHNPAGYNWSAQALEAACKAYYKAAIPDQPVDTSDIAHKLEYAFPQISLSALSEIIEYFRPYLRQPEREMVTHDDLKAAVARFLSGTEYPGEMERGKREEMLDGASRVASALLEIYDIRRRGSDAE